MKTRKILIVDDDIFCRGAMEKLLQSYNYETFSCALAEEAIARLKQESFSILITDLHMPGMDGFELIRNAQIIHPELLTIMVTGSCTDEVKSKANEEGVDGFFCKPINWEELHSLLDNLSGSDEVRNKDMSLNDRKGKGTLLFGRLLISLILFTLITFNVQLSKAQPPFYPKNNPMLRMDGQDASWKPYDLALTEAQKKTLESIQSAYAAEALPLRRELMSLRFELRYLLRDRNVQPSVLLDRQKKISELQAKLDDLSLSYQIKARSIFTKEQLEQLPEDCSPGMETGIWTPIGIGRGERKGIR